MGRLGMALVLCWLGGAGLAQSFDNFEQTPLPPGPGQPEAQQGGDSLDPSWFEGEIRSADEARDDGVTLRTNPGGQSGVVLESFPGVSGPATSVSQPATQEGGRVTLRALDRMLGRPSDIEMEVGQTALFGRIAIHVPECRFPAEDPSSDAFAHLRVFDTGGNALFDGWMVATSPALSALEHPRYDVWVLRCASTS
ncbi:MAG: DUF2155 domain-containing protein [Roseicyclus sp.]